MALLERGPLGSDIPIVEREEGGAQLLHELERHLGPPPGVVQAVRPVFPRPDRRPRAERIPERIREGVPVDHRESEVVFHRLPADDLVRVVVLELERIPGVRAAKLDLGDVCEEVGHRNVTPRDWRGPSMGKIDRSASLGPPEVPGNAREAAFSGQASSPTDDSNLPLPPPPTFARSGASRKAPIPRNPRAKKPEVLQRTSPRVKSVPVIGQSSIRPDPLAGIAQWQSASFPS